mgnify:CR=1 FL=1
MKWNTKSLLFIACVGLAGSALFGFSKGDDRNFRIAKNLDVFNAVFKELDMFYVDTIDPEKVINYSIEAMLAQTDPYTEYYPEEDNTLKEMTSGKFWRYRFCHSLLHSPQACCHYRAVGRKSGCRSRSAGG